MPKDKFTDNVWYETINNISREQPKVTDSNQEQ